MAPRFLLSVRLRAVIAWAGLLVCAGCAAGTSVEDETSGELEVLAKLANGTPAANASVSVYTSKGDFDQKVNAVQTALTNAVGSVTLQGLPQGPLWVYVTQDNPTTLLVLDNQTTTFQLEEAPPTGTSARVTISLKENKSFTTVTFYTAAVAAPTNSISVALEDVTPGRAAQDRQPTTTQTLASSYTSLTPPTSQTAPNVVSFGRVKPGTYRYTATSAFNSCRWVDQIEVKEIGVGPEPGNTGFNPRQLPACDDISITVFTRLSPSLAQTGGTEFSVFLGPEGLDELGVILFPYTGTSDPACGGTLQGMVTASRPKGSYNLRAELRSSSGQVLRLWNFTLTETTPGACVIVELN